MPLPQTAQTNVGLQAIASILSGELTRLKGNEWQESDVPEVLGPFIEALKLFSQRGEPIQATQLCMGLLLGLYQLDTQAASQRAGWPAEALKNLAEAVVFEWKNGAPSKEAMAAVIVFTEEYLGEWGKRLV